jgi:hypothetical protein
MPVIELLYFWSCVFLHVNVRCGLFFRYHLKSRVTLECPSLFLGPHGP